MGSNANRLRKKWQSYSGKNASNAEHSFFETFQILFADTEYSIKRSPNDFKDLVTVKVPLQIYCNYFG